MKKTFIWILAIIITVAAALYQRKTGPTYPIILKVTLNNVTYDLKLNRSKGLDERPEIKLAIKDPTIKGNLFYKRYNTDDTYQQAAFVYKEYPVNSFVMNKIFKISTESGLFAPIPQQPPAGKLQYYIEITDLNSTQTFLKETPVVIRFKGGVPGYILTPHILFMFLAMLFSTAAGLLALFKMPSYKKNSYITLATLFTGGMILGPIVQKYAFGAFWTGVPFGWDLTDNKTLIAFLIWIIAVIIDRKKEKPGLIILASLILIFVFSIPHSLFGSELDYSSGKVVQGFIIIFFSCEKKILS
jgi:hypothetical protein